MPEETEKKEQEEKEKTELENTEPKNEDIEGKTTPDIKGEGTEPKIDEKDEKLEEAQQEIDRLKKENEEFKQSDTKPQAVPAIASEEQAVQFFGNMTNEEYDLKWAEKCNGKTKDETIATFERATIKKLNEKLQARLTFNDALDDAVSKNSRLTKLKGDIKEFFDKFVSDKDKADIDKVKNFIKEAEIYARGKYNMESQNKQIRPSTQTIEPNREIGNRKETKKDNETRVFGSDGKQSIKVKSFKGLNNSTIYEVDTLDESPKFS